ncbi:MAG: hypothetical protein AAFR37_25370, partial [Cyanobacteria bacterium J06628_3]
MKPSLDLFQEVESDKLLILAAIKPRAEKPKSGRKKSKSLTKVQDTVTFFDPNEYMQSLIDSLHNVCAVRIAAELIEMMDLDKLNLATLENLLESTSKSAPLTEEKLNEITGLPTPAPLRASVESHYRPDKWKKDANNFGVFESISKNITIFFSTYVNFYSISRVIFTNRFKNPEIISIFFPFVRT